MPRATITALNIYPVKSCRGIAMDRVTLTAHGFAADRNWMIVDDANRFITQREVPRLALIKTLLDGESLKLQAPGMPELPIIPSAPGAPLRVAIWSDRCAALDEGAAPADWLSTFAARTLRLVRFDTRHQRLADRAYTQEVQAQTLFSDGFPLLIIAEASLAKLNQRLQVPLPMNRFRANIVISGVQAHDEDKIKELRSDTVRMRLVKPCTRCKITTTDQATGQVMGDEPLRTLKTYRWDSTLHGVTFGQNAILIRGIGSSLKLGQQLDIEWA